MTKNHKTTNQALPPSTVFKIMSILALTRLLESGPWAPTDGEDEEIGKALKALHRALETRLNEAFPLD